jgi:hypothetical protein
VLITEDHETGTTAAQAAAAAVAYGASWGLYLTVNQAYPFAFRGTADDAIVYAKIRQLTTP